MLKIQLEKLDLFNESANEFITAEAFELQLEHSLISVSKWESKFERPFLSSTDKTHGETIGYIECMTLNDELPEHLSRRLTEQHIQSINDYVTAKMTATWFNEPKNQPKSREIITAEVIYWWMISLEIPMECETWHLNRLFTLIKVVNEKRAQAANNGKKRPMTKSDLAARRQLNEARRSQLGTSG